MGETSSPAMMGRAAAMGPGALEGRKKENLKDQNGEGNQKDSQTRRREGGCACMCVRACVRLSRCDDFVGYTFDLRPNAVHKRIRYTVSACVWNNRREKEKKGKITARRYRV